MHCHLAALTSQPLAETKGNRGCLFAPGSHGCGNSDGQGELHEQRAQMRGERPFVFANIGAGTDVPEIAAFIETEAVPRSGGVA